MKTRPTIAAFLGASSMFDLFAAEAARDRITVEAGGVSFKIDRYDDGRSKPYRVIFTEDGVRSAYKFNIDGFVTNIKTGSEEYKVLYRSNGDLKRVDLTSSRRRRLDLAEEVEEEDHEEEESTEVEGSNLRSTRGRRLYSCDHCAEAWDAICDEGVRSVCALVGYGSPLSAVAQASIDIMCETFGDACSRSGACEACAGQCEGGDEEKCGDPCGTGAIYSDDGGCACPDGFLGDPLVSCTTSENTATHVSSQVWSRLLQDVRSTLLAK